MRLFSDIFVAIQKVLFRLLLKLPEQQLIVGAGKAQEIGENVYLLGDKKPLIVTEKILVEMGKLEKLEAGLKARGIEYAIFDGVMPDPSYEVVNAGYDIYEKENCDSVIALGGGSTIDSAKGIAVAGARNEKLTVKHSGLFKARKAVNIYAIPSTSGTGSETTGGSIITDSKKGVKTVIVDSVMCPKVVVLDPEITSTLPKGMTAATSFDALLRPT